MWVVTECGGVSGETGTKQLASQDHHQEISRTGRAEMEQLRTDRVGLLVDQLVDGVSLSRLRLDGLTTAELVWEPWPGMWSVRPRGTAASPAPAGSGSWVLDNDPDLDPFVGGPLTTMAWRIGHLLEGFAGRNHWTFGERNVDPHDLVDFDPRHLMDRLWAQVDIWVAGVESLSDAQLDAPGFGQYPLGADRELPFITIIRWMNREAIHHLAEVALLRDQYARLASRSQPPSQDLDQ